MDAAVMVILGMLSAVALCWAAVTQRRLAELRRAYEVAATATRQALIIRRRAANAAPPASITYSPARRRNAARW